MMNDPILECITIKEYSMDLNPLDRLPGKAKPALDVAHLPVPEDIRIEKDPQSLRISYSDFKTNIWLALTCGAFFIAGGIYLLTTGALGFIYITSLLLGSFFIYSSLVGIFNQRTILVTREQLKVSYGPLPFERNHSLDPSELSQLYTHQLAVPTRYREISGFTLEAILRDGRLMPLLTDTNYEKVHFIEVQIESWLGIQDIVVPGEITT
jgi:hypothetical protein